MDTKEELYLKSILEGICEFPEEIDISRKVDEMGVLLTLKLNQKDMGVVIGKEGNTVKAIRTLIRIVGMKAQQRINLKIIDPRAAQTDDAYNQAKSV
jgi:predicted RNA-binding protein YlqC (UPF0109 family)